MNTKINLTYEGERYVLEYNRTAVKMLEANGFELEAFTKKPMSNIEMVFAGAFIKNHRKVSQNIIDQIYASCPDKDGLVANLINMINECYDSLMSEPESDEGNVSWEVVGLKPKTKA